MPPPDFIPGLLLNELFFRDVVSPILATEFSGLPYSAGLLGPGSDVLGYDTTRSTDHEWGPRLILFLNERDHERFASRITTLFGDRLPPLFQGFSTHFSPADAEGVQIAAEADGGPIRHKIQIQTSGAFFAGLPVGESDSSPMIVDWLLTPQQRLLEVTSGALYRDDLGIARLRERLRWYPPDLWRYLMAAQWQRIGQQEPFVGRTGESADELGSRLITAGLVRDYTRLGFLIERTYAPYSKWFGTAFRRLALAATMTDPLHSALAAPEWREREAHLNAVSSILARAHNDLGLTAPLDTAVSGFHGRPFQVIHAERFASGLMDSIRDSRVRAVVDRIGLVGSVDQISDSVDVLSQPATLARIRSLYDAFR